MKVTRATPIFRLADYRGNCCFKQSLCVNLHDQFDESNNCFIFACSRLIFEKKSYSFLYLACFDDLKVNYLRCNDSFGDFK